MSIHCYCSFNLNKIWLDATVENKGIFKVAIVKICCISWAPAIFHLWWPSFHRCKNSCIWINYSSIRNLLLFRLCQNVLITKGNWILLHTVASALTKWGLLRSSKTMAFSKWGINDRWVHDMLWQSKCSEAKKGSCYISSKLHWHGNNNDSVKSVIHSCCHKCCVVVYLVAG